MMIWTARLTRKKAVLAVLLLGAVLIAAILFAGAPEEHAADPQLDSNSDRVAYLASLGWTVEEEPVETLQFLMPERLEEPYLTYNELQDAQGFDLSTACGKQVARYTYAVTNYPGHPERVQLNLFVCQGLPVAGDVFCTGPDGFQRTLVFPEDS